MTPGSPQSSNTHVDDDDEEPGTTTRGIAAALKSIRPVPVLAPDTLVQQRFRILEQLGAGGMGDDGLAGARSIRAAGGRIITEAERTCVVYGMPRAVVEAGMANAEAPLDELPALLMKLLGV